MASGVVLPFDQAVRARRAVRDFVPEPLPEAVLRAVLEDAQCSPSNCNTQPWLVHIVSGAKRDELSKALLAAQDENLFSPDFSFDIGAFQGCYAERSRAQGAEYYRSLGIAREDYDERLVAGRRNLEFFGAPHVALLFMPAVGDNVRVAADIGIYGQTFLLSLAARGYAGVPQTMLGFFAGSARQVLQIPDEYKLLFGISFGRANEDAAGRHYRIGRVAIDECVTFHH